MNCILRTLIRRNEKYSRINLSEDGGSKYREVKSYLLDERMIAQRLQRIPSRLVR